MTKTKVLLDGEWYEQDTLTVEEAWEILSAAMEKGVSGTSVVRPEYPKQEVWRMFMRALDASSPGTCISSITARFLQEEFGEGK